MIEYYNTTPRFNIFSIRTHTYEATDAEKERPEATSRKRNELKSPTK